MDLAVQSNATTRCWGLSSYFRSRSNAARPGVPCTICSFKEYEDDGLWELWKPFCGFQGSVGAFCASTDPAASTACRDAACCVSVTPSSAASPGVPRGPCAPAPALDMRPGEVVRGVHPVGSCAVERQYRGDATPRRVEP